MFIIIIIIIIINNMPLCMPKLATGYTVVSLVYMHVLEILMQL